MSWSITEISAIQKDFESLQRNLDLIYQSLQEGGDPQELVSQATKKFQLLRRQLKGKVPDRVLQDLDETAAWLVQLARARVIDLNRWPELVGAPFKQAWKAILSNDEKKRK